ncbi:hypothetical protein A2961_04170 [Candidatus Woesebacteria bacterium RIFCSPLOWO2_01_FULL_39_21]|uniref:Nucleotide pyrophosphohydrolase n=1 Tax=Candidatus Woesebacteria bacterium RIFCSPLOWO2_01_FULL_39_21 TaxID=1802519 RepID=A0A1F8BDQ7_9BACT|nr:MAG: hypothetical protein A2961_04170 [Candidatus Woesebacteria bacterium RIFCSPLOWO2_01_FULL_39_21]
MEEDTKKIIKFQKQRDWKQFHTPKNLAISLSLEANEVLEIFQWTKDNQLPSDKKLMLEEEIADVYYYLLLLPHTPTHYTFISIDLHKKLVYL